MTKRNEADAGELTQQFRALVLAEGPGLASLAISKGLQPPVSPDTYYTHEVYINKNKS